MHIEWRLYGKPGVSSVPIAAGGENRERPFAKNAENREAAIRYALDIFLPVLWRSKGLELLRSEIPRASPGHHPSLATVSAESLRLVF
jgi:hypothetical protein